MLQICFLTFVIIAIHLSNKAFLNGSLVSNLWWNENNCFCCHFSEACHKRITFLLSAMTDEVHKTILQICHHIQKDNADFIAGDRLLTELDHELANQILVASTSSHIMEMGVDGDDDDELMDRSRSPSPPRVFCGEIVK